MSSTSAGSQSSRRWSGFGSFWVRALLLAVLGLAVYGASLGNGFVMDDEEQVLNNSLTESLTNLPEILTGAYAKESGSTKTFGVYFRPLMITSFTAIRAVFGQDPVAYHSFQLFVHVLNSILLMAFFARFAPPAFAFVAAAIFLVHPMNVEAVSYVASLQDPLCALFGLAALNWVASRRDFGWLHAIPVALLFFASLLGKETGALLIFASVLYGLFFKREASVKVAVAAFVAVLGYLLLRIGVAGLTAVEHASTQLARASFETRLLTLPAVLASYLGKFAVPWTLATTQDWIVTSLDPLGFWLPLGFVTAVTLACVSYGRARGRSAFVFFFVWALAGLGLHSHLLTALDGTVAERWFYIPCMGLIGMCSTIANEKRDWLRTHARTVAVAAALVVVAFSIRSYSRSLVWRDGFTLYSTDVETQPDSAHLQNNVGVELFRRGKIEEARTRFEASVRLNPHWTISWNNLGATFHRVGDLKKAEECYANSVRSGSYLLAYQNYPIVLAQQGRPDEALRFVVDKALPAYPTDRTLLALREQLSRR